MEWLYYAWFRTLYIHASKLNLTYQKANKIVKNFLLEESNRINILKYKIEEKFPLIHFIYLLLFSKIFKRTSNFGIQKKNNFDLCFQTWKNRKTAGAIAPKLLKQLPLDQAKHTTTEVLSTAKGPSNYQDSAVPKNEQMPIDIKISNIELVRPTMVSVNNKTWNCC